MKDHADKKGAHPVAVALLTGCLVFLVGVSSETSAKPREARDADDLYIVDCLLPGQMRKLGRQMTYLTARRPVKTSAQDCEIRGGEYVSYDRASYGAALKVWLPLAEEGDKEAQTYVGEIYEKGLGLEPDYVVAANWYRKASEQGYSRAQINLAQLYEKGLGVEKDPIQALNWYRKASGIEDSVIMDSGTLNDNARELESLRKEVVDRKAEAELLRGKLEETRSQLEQARERLRRQERETQSEREELERMRTQLQEQKSMARVEGDPAKLAALDEELRQRQSEVARKDQELVSLRQEIARVESEASRHRQQLTVLEGRDEEIQALRAEVARSKDEATQLRTQLGETREQLQQVRSEASQRTADVEAARQALAQAKAQLEQGRQETVRDDQAIAKLEKALKEREAALAERQQGLERLNQEVRRVESEAERYRTQLASMEKQQDKLAKGKLAAPKIEIIDPQIAATRGVAAVSLRSAASERLIVGKVNAPAGLISLMVNDRAAEPNETGVFRLTVPVHSKRTPVSVVAVDKRGNRSVVAFEMVRGDAETTRAVAKTEPSDKNEQIPDVDFGQYHALIIGNDNYTKLPRLSTAVRDAEAVDELLRTRYSFTTTKLIDADRYQILSALNELRENLTEEHNLLIYYAGHGELDEVNLRGHWLPVDAEPDSSANWISNVAITDVLNAMNVRRVLIVADSCYSGALTRSALGRLAAGLSDEAKANWLRVMAKKRSRTALTSGGTKPVLDTTGGKHSVFANAFIKVLHENRDLIEGRRLFSQISDQVTAATSRVDFSQVPEYAPIKYAGHEGGDFFFLPI